MLVDNSMLCNLNINFFMHSCELTVMSSSLDADVEKWSKLPEITRKHHI